MEPQRPLSNILKFPLAGVVLLAWQTSGYIGHAKCLREVLGEDLSEGLMYSLPLAAHHGANLEALLEMSLTLSQDCLRYNCQ